MFQHPTRAVRGAALGLEQGCGKPDAGFGVRTIFMKTCGHLFERWQRNLDADPNLWSVRRVQEGHVWRNAASVAIGKERWITWDELTAQWGPEQAKKVADAHELVLKLGGKSIYSGILKTPVRGKLMECDAIHSADICPHCEMKCAIVLGLLIPLTDCASGEPLPQVSASLPS